MKKEFAGWLYRECVENAKQKTAPIPPATYLVAARWADQSAVVGKANNQAAALKIAGKKMDEYRGKLSGLWFEIWEMRGAHVVRIAGSVE